MYKLPYIKDKDLFKAVKCACKMVAQSGWFNKAVNWSANYYGVDPDDVAKYVRIAQGNGQRISNKKNPRKYHWYVVEFSVMNGLDPYFYPAWARYEIKKATSKINAEEAVRREYFCYGNGSETSYIDIYTGRVEEFDSKDKAEECAYQWKKDNDEFIANTNGITGSADGCLTALDIGRMVQKGFFNKEDIDI